MNTKTPEQTLQNENDIIIIGNEPDWIYLLLHDFHQKKMIEKNPELRVGQQFTGYPLLLHIIDTFVLDKHPQGKKILEIGGGITCGLENIKYLRKLTDTVDVHGNKEHHAFGIDLRNGVAIISKVFAEAKYAEANKENLSMEKLEEARMNLAAIKSGAIKAWDWADIGKLTDNKGEPLTFDCIFNHRIGPNPEGYEAVTDAALNPGGYYIAFRDQGSISPEPVDKNFFHEDRYDDLSFSFEFRKKLLNKKHGYAVTIFRKLTESEKITRGIQDDTHSILGG